MWSLVKVELKKMHRCNVLYVGIVIFIFPPLLSVLQHVSMNNPSPGYGIRDIMNATIWYNMSLFMPVTLMVLGGYMMNREYVDDTLKNIFTIPISYERLLYGKLLALLVFTVIYCLYSYTIAFLVSFFFFPGGLTVSAAVSGFFQILGMGVCLLVSILPFLVWSSGKKNRYLVGSVMVFLYSFSGIPIAGRTIRDFYPISAGLSIIRYNGDVGSHNVTYHPEISMIVLLLSIILSYIIIKVQGNFRGATE